VRNTITQSCDKNILPLITRVEARATTFISLTSLPPNRSSYKKWQKRLADTDIRNALSFLCCKKNCCAQFKAHEVLELRDMFHTQTEKESRQWLKAFLEGCVVQGKRQYHLREKVVKTKQNSLYDW
jgi:hypothetical protein